MPESLNDIAKTVATIGSTLGCYCQEFAHLIVEQDKEIKKLKAEIEYMNSVMDSKPALEDER